MLLRDNEKFKKLISLRKLGLLNKTIATTCQVANMTNTFVENNFTEVLAGDLDKHIAVSVSDLMACLRVNVVPIRGYACSFISTPQSQGRRSATATMLQIRQHWMVCSERRLCGWCQESLSSTGASSPASLSNQAAINERFMLCGVHVPLLELVCDSCWETVFKAPAHDCAVCLGCMGFRRILTPPNGETTNDTPPLIGHCAFSNPRHDTAEVNLLIPPPLPLQSPPPVKVCAPPAGPARPLRIKRPVPQDEESDSVAPKSKRQKLANDASTQVLTLKVFVGAPKQLRVSFDKTLYNENSPTSHQAARPFNSIQFAPPNAPDTDMRARRGHVYHPDLTPLVTDGERALARKKHRATKKAAEKAAKRVSPLDPDDPRLGDPYGAGCDMAMVSPTPYSPVFQVVDNQDPSPMMSNRAILYSTTTDTTTTAATSSSSSDIPSYNFGWLEGGQKRYHPTSASDGNSSIYLFRDDNDLSPVERLQREMFGDGYDSDEFAALRNSDSLYLPTVGGI